MTATTPRAIQAVDAWADQHDVDAQRRADARTLALLGTRRKCSTTTLNAHVGGHAHQAAQRAIDAGVMVGMKPSKGGLMLRANKALPDGPVALVGLLEVLKPSPTMMADLVALAEVAAQAGMDPAEHDPDLDGLDPADLLVKLGRAQAALARITADLAVDHPWLDADAEHAHELVEVLRATWRTNSHLLDADPYDQYLEDVAALLDDADEGPSAHDFHQALADPAVDLRPALDAQVPPCAVASVLASPPPPRTKRGVSTDWVQVTATRLQMNADKPTAWNYWAERAGVLDCAEVAA